MDYISSLRQYIGHEPIMMPAAMGIIYDENKGILLEQRSDNGQWCMPGGGLELGETQEEGLRRETKEETNLDIFNPELFTVRANVHMIYPNQDEVFYTDIVFIVREFSGELKPDAESVELKWFSLDDVPSDMVPTQTEYIQKFKEYLTNK